MALAGQLQKSPNPKTEVLAVVDALNDAGLHRDVNKLRSLYSPQYFHTNPDGSLMQLADVLASYQKPSPFKFESSSADERRVLLAGDSAVVNERLSLHGRKNGDPFVSRYRVTYVLVRGTQGWKVINSHASLLGIETPGK
jgi:ketosteroid isomerase-like protein